MMQATVLFLLLIRVKGAEISPTFIVSTTRAISVGNSFIWKREVMPSAVLLDMSPWLFLVSLSSEI